jgi:KAP family P-loop domain
LAVGVEWYLVSPSIPIVADTPSSNPRLGFESYAEALAAAIRGGTPSQFTIGIYGPWGSGKSSLLKATEMALSGYDDVIAIPFDAWRYESADHIVIPLLHAIYRRIPEFGNEKLTEKVRATLKSLLSSLTFSLGPVSIDGGALLRPEASDDISALDMAFAKPYQDMQAIASALDGRRIAVLIDDLDRCSPGKAVALLEAINLVMDSEGFIFVLALDYDVIVKAVSERYPYASGHVFIEKLIQVPFRVPPMDLNGEAFLEELIPDWASRSISLPDGFEGTAYDIATMALGANPRQIKRLINSVLVLLHVASNRDLSIDSRILSGLVGLQLRWPDEYRDLSEAVLLGDSDPLAPLRAEGQGGLNRYVELFFKKFAKSEQLRPYIQLSQAVAVSTAGDAEGAGGSERGNVEEARLARDRHMTELIALLVAKQYAERGGVYVNSSNAGVRFKFGKTVIRYEKRAGPPGARKWTLQRSLNLLTEYEEAWQLISKLT